MITRDYIGCPSVPEYDTVSVRDTPSHDPFGYFTPNYSTSAGVNTSHWEDNIAKWVPELRIFEWWL